MKYLFLLLQFILAGSIAAQSIQPVGDGNIAYGGAGLDGAVVVEGGYVTPHLFIIPPLDFSLAIPTGKIFSTPGSYRFEAHSHWEKKIYNQWGYNLKPGTRIYTLRSPTWSGFAWYLDFQTQVGYIAPNWAVTLDLGLAPKMTTYVAPSDDAKTNYSGIQSGFYAKGFEALFNYGVSGYWRFTDHFAVGLRAWLTLPIEDSKNPLARSITDGVVSFHVSYYFEEPKIVLASPDDNVMPAKEVDHAN